MDQWKAARQKHTYSRRQPENSVLYRLIYHHRDELERRWDELFSDRYGALRPAALNTLDEYLNCGILAHGCARAYCSACKHSELIAFSCKKRGVCPSCAAKRAVVFAENLHQNILLPYPHRHLVFTLPKRLRPFFRFDRKLLAILFRAAWEAWRECLTASGHNGKPAMVISLHTSGDLLQWHPHLHAIALSGTLDELGAFTPAANIDTVQLEAAFQRRVLGALVDLERLDLDSATNIASWDHSGFSAWVGEPFSGEQQRLFIARYLKKHSLSLERIKLIDSPLGAAVQLVKQLDDGVQTRELSPLEFLAQLSFHIPDTWEQSVRYYGAYAARTRGAKNNAHPFALIAKLQLPLEEDPPRKPSPFWASNIKRVYEIDPLECPKCGAQMKIVAFIHKLSEIKKLTKHLGISDWKPPPQFAGSSGRRVVPVD